MTAQEQLDNSGYHRFEAELPAPLFVDSNSLVEGGGPVNCSTAIVTGWRRGLVNESHFTPDGFRTHNDTYLFARGTEWDLGPRCSWATVRQLTIKIDVTSHNSWGHNTIPLGGMQGEGHYDPHPSPWLLSIINGKVLFSIGTEVDEYNFFGTIPILTARLLIEATADLETGQITVKVNGQTLVINQSLPPNSKLKANATAPFSLGRIDPFFNSGGYFDTVTRDLTFHSVYVFDQAGYFCEYNNQYLRVPTYNGGPSLPLQRCWTRNGGKFLYCVHKSQGVADANGHVRFKDLHINGITSEPAIVIGATFGPMTFDNIRIHKGTRGIQAQGFPVIYPLRIRDCTFQSQADSSIFLMRSMVVIRDTLIQYARRFGFVLLGCQGEIDWSLFAPGGSSANPPSQAEAVVLQRGGTMHYNQIKADYEEPTRPDYAFVKVVPTTYDHAGFSTEAYLTNCFSGYDYTGLMTEVSPRMPGYTAPIIINGVTNAT